MKRPPRLSFVVAGLREDHLLQNSFFIMLATATMGFLGFVFWLISARLFPADQIGVATTLITATNLLSYVSLLGFNTTLITSLPRSSTRSAEIDSALLLVFAAGVVTSLAYIEIIPMFTPELAFVRSSMPRLVGFVLLTAFSAVNLVTDSAFIALRAARFNFFIDGLIQGATKLGSVLVVVGLGSYGLFLASGLAATVALLASIVFLILRFAYRPHMKVRLGAVRLALRQSAANYVANLFNILPIMALPLIVLRVRGSADTGYFFVPFQVASLLYAVTYAISQALLAEGSQAGSELRALARRTAKVQTALILPAAVMLAAIAGPLLGLFGPSYRQHALGTFVVLAAAAPAVALNTWTTALLRLTRASTPLVWSNVLFAAVVCGFAAARASAGLADVALAWLLGNLLSGIAGGAWLALRRSLPAEGAHGPEIGEGPVVQQPDAVKL